ncbi:solute carrier family 40 (iron-regulated transporter), member 1 [Marchantia polymorpha subsp. ruderalis]
MFSSSAHDTVPLLDQVPARPSVDETSASPAGTTSASTAFNDGSVADQSENNIPAESAFLIERDAYQWEKGREDAQETGCKIEMVCIEPIGREDGGTNSGQQENDDAVSPTGSHVSNTSSSSGPPISSLVHFLYWSHFLSRWGDRMWEFAVGLFMITIWPDSLLLAAVYGLTETASIAAFGVVVGNWVDRTPRLKVVQISLVVQNSSVVIAGLSLVCLLAYPDSLPGGSQTFAALTVLVNLCGALAALSGLATNIVVERDWVIVISEQYAPGLLTQLNSIMRRIDLSCKLLAPVFVGFLMSGVSALACALAIAVWNLVSVGIEYKLLHSVYWSIPALQLREAPTVVATDAEDVGLLDGNLPTNREADMEDAHDFVQISHKNQIDRTLSYGNGLLGKCLHLPYIEGWTVYLQQEVMLAGVSLALLYFTVLSFGSLMTAVLNWRGVPAYVLGLARGVAAIIGILATVAYPILQPKLQTVRTGLWSINLQWSLLSISAISVLVHNGVGASAMLIIGVAASRFGLWMFDLSVTQLMQDSVPEHKRGVVGGVQNSLQSLMDMLSYVMAIVISDPRHFGVPVLISYWAVGSAAVLYACYSYRVRGHLIHFEKLFRYSQ